MSGSHVGGIAACLALFTGCLEADLSPLDIEAQEMRVVEGSPDSVGLLDFLNAIETTVEVLDFDAKLDQHFTSEGPVVFIWKIARAEEPVPKPSRPIRERAHRLRDALVG